MIFFWAVNYYQGKKNSNILALKFEHFSISLYKALCLLEVDLAYKWPEPFCPPKRAVPLLILKFLLPNK